MCVRVCTDWRVTLPRGLQTKAQHVGYAGSESEFLAQKQCEDVTGRVASSGDAQRWAWTITDLVIDMAESHCAGVVSVNIGIRRGTGRGHDRPFASL